MNLSPHLKTLCIPNFPAHAGRSKAPLPVLGVLCPRKRVPGLRDVSNLFPKNKLTPRLLPEEPAILLLPKPKSPPPA